MAGRAMRPAWAVADVLGINRQTVYSWVRRGQLEHVQRDPATRALLVNMLEVQQLAERGDEPD
jgi:predicted site-specific integrase-resolvase